MSKNKQKKSDSVTVVRSHRKANIAVGIIVGIAALLLIAVAVLCMVRVDPLDKVDKPVRYDLYDLGTTAPLSTSDSEQSKIRNALNDMDFNVMSAILRWNWDYSYNFVRKDNGDKLKLSSEAIENVKATSTSYMIEYVYNNATVVNGVVDKKTAHSLEVDGETIYFDRIKVLISNTDGNIGDIYLYPYVYEIVANKAANDGLTYESYSITGVKVKANTTEAYAAIQEIVQANKNL